MLKFTLVILVIFVVVVIGFLIAVATRPSEFQIVRSITIAAPPNVVFEQVNDFHKWDAWSPWAKLDPNMKTTFEGPPTGTGAIYTWTGDKTVGEGRMTILESKPNELVRLKLEFMKPFKATNTADFTFKPEGDTTTVSWIMTGTNNFMFKAVHMIIDMDKMLGTQFEQGLSQLKTVSETASK